MHRVAVVRISASTRLACLIGTPVAHSISPAVHNFIYRDLNVDMVYLAFRIDDVSHGVTAMRALGVRGVGVSIPYKVEVMSFLDEVDPVAYQIGAVNTIVNNDGVLRGYNTDVSGSIAALSEATDLDGARVALLGAGGAARAIAYGLKRSNSIVTVFNRTVRRAEALVDEVGLAAYGGLDEHGAIAANDVIINASSVGLGDRNLSPVPKEVITPGSVVFDAVYGLTGTRLLEDATAAGATTVLGERMLMHGVREQAELFTGRSVTLELAEAALRDAMGEP